MVATCVVKHGMRDASFDLRFTAQFACRISEQICTVKQRVFATCVVKQGMRDASFDLRFMGLSACANLQRKTHGSRNLRGKTGYAQRLF